MKTFVAFRRPTTTWTSSAKKFSDRLGFSLSDWQIQFGAES
jgi:hypothetical protein